MTPLMKSAHLSHRRGWETSWLTSTQWTAWCWSHASGESTWVRRTSWGTKPSWRAWAKEAASANTHLRWKKTPCSHYTTASKWWRDRKMVNMLLNVFFLFVFFCLTACKKTVAHSSSSQHYFMGGVHHGRAWKVSISYIFALVFSLFWWNRNCVTHHRP